MFINNRKGIESVEDFPGNPVVMTIHLHYRTCNTGLHGHKKKKKKKLARHNAISNM